MGVDRLAELGDSAPGRGADIEAGDSSGEEKFMSNFFESVGRIKAKMSAIRANLKNIEKGHEEAMGSIFAKDSKSKSVDLETLMEETNAMAQDIRNDLKHMEEANKKFLKENEGSSEARIRTNMQSTLSRKFMELMTEYQDIQQRHRDQYKERVQRQFKIVKPDATEEEIEEKLSGNSQNIFADMLLTKQHREAQNAMADIQEKHEDIMKLETSIKELHQLFVDMAVLVEGQGELLNHIEHNVDQSVAYVDKGVEELGKAREYQKAARKKMMYICCCLTIVLGVVAAISLGVMSSKGNL